MGILLEWLTINSPDVMCLQETKVVDADFPVTPLRDAGYHVVYSGEKSYNGVAILSRHEPASVAFGLDDGGPPDNSRLACIKIGKLHVVNTYIPQGRDIEHPMYRYKLEWFERLRTYFDLKFKPSQPLVWVGDLNIAPAAPDIHNSGEQTNHVCYHVDVRRAFEKTMDWGFVDVFRKHHPESGQYTFFDYRLKDAVERGLGWRIDHVMASTSLASKSTGAWIDLMPRRAERPSDHAVLVAEFEI